MRTSRMAGAARISPLGMLLAWDEWIGRWAHARGRGAVALHEFLCFGVKQASACLFGGSMVLLLELSWAFYPVHAMFLVDDHELRDGELSGWHPARQDVIHGPPQSVAKI